MVPLVTYHRSQKTEATALAVALQTEFPHHAFETRLTTNGLMVVLLPTPDAPYSDAVQWYAIGWKDHQVGRDGE